MIKPTQCRFFQESVDYIQHFISPGQLHVESKCQDAIREALQLGNISELRSFLGLCKVYPRFDPNFERIAAPLNKKLMKGEPQTFRKLTNDESVAYMTFQDSMLSPQVLVLPKSSGKYVEIDVCDLKVGCVLMQEEEDEVFPPIGY